MPFLGPVTGPLVAGACTVSGTSMLNRIIDWRWVYWLTMIWAGAVFIVMIFFLPETQAPAILQLKARAVRKQTGDDKYYSDNDQRPESNLKLVLTAFPKPIILLFTEPIIMALSCKASFCFEHSDSLLNNFSVLASHLRYSIYGL